MLYEPGRAIAASTARSRAPHAAPRPLLTAALLASALARRCGREAAPRYRDGEVGARATAAAGRRALRRRATRRSVERSAPGAGSSRPTSRRPRSGCRAPGRAERDAELRRAPLGLGAAATRARGAPAGWQQMQWNFLAETGRQRAARRGRTCRPSGAPAARASPSRCWTPGSRTRTADRFRRSPDFAPHRFIRGWDFVGRGPVPERRQRARHARREHDRREHRQRDRADRARLRRQADAGQGARPRRRGRLGADRAAASAGPRTTARRSSTCRSSSRRTSRAPQIPNILDAIRYARRKGVLVVGASGQRGGRRRRLPGPLERRALGRRDHPARLPGRLLQRGHGPGHRRAGRRRRRRARGRPGLPPAGPAGLDIYQMTFSGSVRAGSASRTATSAPRWRRRTCPATAALVIASGLLGPNPTPDAIERRLKLTARDLGPAGQDPHYGWGRLDAARATRSRDPGHVVLDDQDRAGRVMRDLVRAPSRAGSAARRSCPCCRPRSGRRRAPRRRRGSRPRGRPRARTSPPRRPPRARRRRRR